MGHPDQSRKGCGLVDFSIKMVDENTQLRVDLNVGHCAYRFIHEGVSDGLALAKLHRDGARVFTQSAGNVEKDWSLPDAGFFEDGRIPFLPGNGVDRKFSEQFGFPPVEFVLESVECFCRSGSIEEIVFGSPVFSRRFLF